MTARTLTQLALILALGGGIMRPQTPSVGRLPSAPPAAESLKTSKVLFPNLQKAELLPAGKTQGQFHLLAFVKPNHKVVLRWANTHGELPTEGVTVWRLKAGDRETNWKELNRRDPVSLFRGPKVKERLKALRPESRDAMLALFHSDLQHDPATKQRLVGKPAGAVTRAKDLSPEKAADQYRTLRAQGRLAKQDLQVLTSHADADPSAADLLGLGYEDDPGKGKWRYKIQVKLPEGGTVEVLCPKEVDSTQPTPVPAAVNLAAKSGNGAVLLNWDVAPSEAVAGFNVYRADTEKGPWRRLNDSPVKLVTLETEDPETVLRREVAVQGALEKELKKATGQPLTAAKIADLRLQAQEAASAPPTLSPAVAAQVKAAVASGRVLPGGKHKPLSAFTDDRRKTGNSDLMNDRPYLYRITTVDVAGGETAVETAPVIAGTPKDLEPPKVPGRPMLKGQAEALQRLQSAQSLRIQDPRLKELEVAQASKMPMKTQALAPVLGSGAAVVPGATLPPPAVPPAYASVSVGEIRKQRLGRLAATMPAPELKEAAAATLLRSLPDGSVPPATLVWTPSPDPDLKHYEVWRAAGAAAPQKVAEVGTAAYTDTALEVGVAYHYAIVAVDQRGNESQRSDEGLVEVSDSRLPGKLAVQGLQGAASTAVLVPGTPHRSYLRPVGKTFKLADKTHLAKAGAALKLPAGLAAPTAATSAQGMAASAAKPGTGVLAPKAAGAPKGLGLASPMAGVKTLEVATADPKTMSFPAVTTKALMSPKALALNVMLVEPANPKEIRVILEWKRPLEGMPLEYAIFQAPQKFEVKHVARPEVTMVEGFSLREAGAARPTATATPTLSASAVTLAAKTAPAGGGASAAMSPGTFKVVTSPEVHASVVKGVVATSAGALREAPSRKGMRAQLVLVPEPGTFTKVNEAPVGVERFAVTFPADAAQFGGATFYFRVQAFTREFGRLVEGPQSAPVEVRLPDVVAPAAPATGALTLASAGGDQFNVALDWAQVSARDLAGYVVERQTFNTTIVDGLVQPTSAQGDPVKVTPEPLTARTFLEKAAPGGYQRYTVRAVDKSGNASEPSTPLDVFVPGETVPGAPTGLALAGNRLTWKAAPNALGYSVWRSFSGLEEDFEQISGLLGAEETGFNLPAQGTLHLRVVARSRTGMHQTASGAILRPAP